MVKPVKSQNIAPFGHLEAGHQIASANLVFPGVRGKLKRSITTPDGVELQSGTSVIIQPLNRDKHGAVPKFKITPYYKNTASARSDQPESQRDVIADASHEVEIADPEAYLNFNNEHFRRSHEALFPNADSPTLSEINQARVPNCFLLGAIQTLINHPNGKSFIRGMMRQNDDGTTTVRLYDPVTLQPEYIKVENSVLIDGLGSLNLHGALWVHILEKAYAARGKKDGKTVDASASTVFGGGGQPSEALTTLTGVKTSQRSPEPNVIYSPLKVEEFLADMYAIIGFNLDAAIGKEPEEINEQLSNALTMLEPIKLKSIYNLFKADENDAAAKKAALSNYGKLIKCYKANPEQFKTAVKERSAEMLNKKHPEASRVLKDIFQRFKPFSGNYTLYQQAIFKDLQDHVGQHRLITGSTKTKFEKKVPGLVTNHAYTILGVEEGPVEIIDENGRAKTITAYYVVVRNPWGNLEGPLNTLRNLATDGVGMGYKQHPTNKSVKQVATDEATSFIELNTFCENFHCYTFSESVEQLFKRDADKEKCIADINQFVETHNIDFTSSNMELIIAKETYDNHVKNLLELELQELTVLDANSHAALTAIFDARYDAKLEETTILGLIDEKLFPRISGDASSVKRHVYALLKLKWLQTQDIPEKTEEVNRCMDIMQQHATQQNLWDALSQVNFVIMTVLSARSSSQRDYIQTMNDLAAQLKTQMEKFAALFDASKPTNAASIDATFEQLVANLQLMERLFYQVFNLNLTAKKFNYQDTNYDNMNEFIQIIQQCKELLEPVIQVKPEFKKLWDLRKDIEKTAVSLEAKHKITAEDHSYIQIANSHPFSGKLKEEGEKHLRSTDSEVQDLGRKLLEADTIAKKIKKAVTAVRNFFSRVTTCISTLFHLKNAYELPAPNHTVTNGIRGR